NLVNASGRLAARIGHKQQYSLVAVIVGMAPESTTEGRIRIKQKRNKCTSVTETEIRQDEPTIPGRLLSADRDLAAHSAHGHERAGRARVLDGPEARVLHGAVGDGDVGGGGPVQEGHRDPPEQRAGAAAEGVRDGEQVAPRAPEG